MSSNYVEPRKHRFQLERVDGAEQIRIPTRRNWFVLLFVSFWICGWTVAGLTTMHELAQHFDLFTVFWLGGWAFGWVFAAATIGSQLVGSEIIRIFGRDLEMSAGIGPIRRRRLYRGDHIHCLDSSDPNPMALSWWQGSRVSRSAFTPFGKAAQGAIKFDYGAETIYAASSVDEAEGRMIVAWLAPKLPRTATQPPEHPTSGSANFTP